MKSEPDCHDEYFGWTTLINVKKSQLRPNGNARPTHKFWRVLSEVWVFAFAVEGERAPATALAIVQPDRIADSCCSDKPNTRKPHLPTLQKWPASRLTSWSFSARSGAVFKYGSIGPQ